MNISPVPQALIILDGWGYSETLDANAIQQANTPVWDNLWHTYPHSFLEASGTQVGLPAGQMGNSEVGHLNLGSGRVVYQDLTRISLAIKEGTFFKNQELNTALDIAKDNDGAVHIMGLLSAGGVHSHEDHIIAMLELTAQKGIKKFYLHAFLDGRDTPPKSAEAVIIRVQKVFKDLGRGQFASLSGRYYSMDRDQRWERQQPAYEVIVKGIGEYQADDALTALHNAYARGETDEFVKATALNPAVSVQDGDTVVFMNFRADRARQMTRAFIEPNFSGFERGDAPKLSRFTCLTEYCQQYTVPVAFPPTKLPQVFGEIIAENGLRQLRIAETEKYAHVTFFFNGGVETVYKGEDRELIPSPKVATYDLQPEMNAPELTDKLVAAITRQTDPYSAIICNFANTDMVGHTGNLEATIKAVETIDACLKRIVEAMDSVGGELLITADHGNAEKLRDNATQQAHTAHTSNPVPFIYVGKRAIKIREKGVLSDVAPTMLHLLGLDIPDMMTGQPLVSLAD